MKNYGRITFTEMSVETTWVHRHAHKQPWDHDIIYIRYSIGNKSSYIGYCGWSGGVMAPGKLPVPGPPTIWMIVGQ